MNLWIVLLLGGAITFLIRLSFILLIGQRQVSPLLKRGLRFVPPAVLVAIIVPELLVSQGRIDFSLNNERLIAGTIAALVAWRTRSALWTIATGMAILWILTRMSYNY